MSYLLELFLMLDSLTSFEVTLIEVLLLILSEGNRVCYGVGDSSASVHFWNTVSALFSLF